MSNDKDTELRELERHASQLGENFDTVRIITTTHRDGQTVMHSFGAGNFYAQFGSVKEWVQRQEADIKNSIKKEHNDD